MDKIISELKKEIDAKDRAIIDLQAEIDGKDLKILELEKETIDLNSAIRDIHDTINKYT